MPTVHANGIDIFYEERGEGEPLLMIMGIGAQLLFWPDPMLDALAARGYRVICLDNRDCGLSQKMERGPQPDLRASILRGYFGLRQPVIPYTLEDMAMDCAGLLDALGIESAHVVGISMGGMIAQTFAITHGERIRSLTSVMSHPGDRDPFIATPRGVKALLGPRPRNREEAIQGYLRFNRLAGSPGYPSDLEAVRERAGRAYDRCFYPQGFIRQMTAIFASGSRSSRLRMLRTPTLILHGAEDPLIRPRGGRATARAIPGSTLRIFEGWGHNLPPGMIPTLVEAIGDHLDEVEQARASRASRAPEPEPEPERVAWQQRARAGHRASHRVEA